MSMHKRNRESGNSTRARCQRLGVENVSSAAQLINGAHHSPDYCHPKFSKWRSTHYLHSLSLHCDAKSPRTSGTLMEFGPFLPNAQSILVDDLVWPLFVVTPPPQPILKTHSLLQYYGEQQGIQHEPSVSFWGLRISYRRHILSCNIMVNNET
jgi:hypothetical protein